MGIERTFRDLFQGSLRHPESLLDEERRKEARLFCDPVPVRIVINGTESLPVPAHVVNVAESGLGLRLSKDVQLYRGATVVVEVHSLRIRGRVCHCVRTPDTEWLDIGVQIENAERIH
jgi:hypothetical protein